MFLESTSEYVILQRMGLKAYEHTEGVWRLSDAE